MDGGGPEAEGARASTASVLVEVEDVQDQTPLFVNAPFSATVPENTPPGSPIFKVLVRDGDTGLPRKVWMIIEASLLFRSWLNGIWDVSFYFCEDWLRTFILGDGDA